MFHQVFQMVQYIVAYPKYLAGFIKNYLLAFILLVHSQKSL